MAGTNPDFDAAGFRTGVQFAMNMGLPSGAEAPVFHFPDVRSATGPSDQTGLPFDPNQNVTEARSFGLITPTRVEIMLLDVDYALVEGCERVVIDGDTYWYRRTQTPQGLFDVTLYTMHFAVDTEG